MDRLETHRVENARYVLSNLHSSMDRLETYKNERRCSYDLYLHSSMDRLETVINIQLYLIMIVFTFQYG